MRIVFLGLSLSSAWGNGHATTYRSLLRGLHASGHDVCFLEREQPWYASNRDLPDPAFCDFRIYNSVAGLNAYTDIVTLADAVIIGSYVPDGVQVINWVNKHRRGLMCFYDIDTPVTLQQLASGTVNYLAPQSIRLFDIYFSFTGGPTLEVLVNVYNARRPVPLYCSVDPTLYFPTGAEKRWDLGYLGTYSQDRQETLELLLLEPARHLPDRKFVVAGPQYPSEIVWPTNVERIEHLPPLEHAGFYSSMDWTLNVTRRDMIHSGFSPSVRLFEATACGVPVLSDRWNGIEEVLTPDHEVLLVDNAADIIRALSWPAKRCASLGAAGRARTLLKHTGRRRADQLVGYLYQASF